MNLGGWVVLLISCVAILALNVYCFWRVFTLPGEEEEDLHAPLDIDTHDRNGVE
jgi:hypothetical protein